MLLALNVGTVLPAIERLFSVQFLDKTVYYISELPSDLQRADVITIALIALALALLKKHFTTVKHGKPPASRKDSSEWYVIAQGFKG